MKYNKKLLIAELFQNFLRDQGSRQNYNLVDETLIFLDVICGSTKGSFYLFILQIFLIRIFPPLIYNAE